MKPIRSQSWFGRFAKRAAHWSGTPKAFFFATALIVAWLVTGPLFHYSDTWQLVINTTTTIVTFLMVFLIQNTQNRDSVAIQLKLDELIRSMEGAHTALLDLEELDQADLDQIREDYGDLAAKAREALRRGRSDTGRPRVRRHKGAREQN
jgi:low affinity Fe/Cu permease